MNDASRLKVPGKFQPAADHVYSYGRRKDLFEGKTRHLYQPTPSIAEYFEMIAPRLRFFEAPITAFQPWYNEFPFATLFNDTVAGKSEWEFRLMFLNPLSPDSSKENEPALKWAQGLLAEFYNVGATLTDSARTHAAVINVPSIAIFGLNKQHGTKQQPSSKSWYKNKQVEVIAGITFRQGRDKDLCKAIIIWVSVSQSTLHHPWARLGLGTFMLIPVIKLCVIDGRKAVAINGGAVFTPKNSVELYAQCTQPSQQRFFVSCGFVRINAMENDGYAASSDDGIKSLPTSLQIDVAQDELTFIYDFANTLTANYVTPALYKLRGGEFKLRPKYRPIEISDSPAAGKKKRGQKDAKDAVFTWCEYPPPVRTHLTKLASLKDQDVASLFKGVHFVSNLLPRPLGKQIPPTAFCLRGQMSSTSRLHHTPESYMSTGEMEMMMALLMNDGRYDDSVSIVPFSFIEHISNAAAAYAEYEGACVKMEKVLSPRTGERRQSAINIACRGKSPREVDALAKAYDAETKRLQEAANIDLHFDEIAKTSNSKITEIITKVLMPNPSMLDKKLLVMPKCHAKHWSAVFIFNPSYIDLASTRKKQECLQPCFFRYCSIFPDGSRPVPTSHGVMWFLNLAYSYFQHCHTEKPPDARMDWQAPFGQITKAFVADYDTEYLKTNIMWGLPAFPSIRFDKDDIANLPTQGSDDGWNCGFGLVAAIAIIMRDIIGCDAAADAKYFDLFHTPDIEPHDGDPNDGECIIKMKAGCFQPLPTPPKLVWEDGNYLATLRREWFIVMDTLAELQNNHIPHRANSRFTPPLEYTTAKGECEYKIMTTNNNKKAAAQAMLNMSQDLAAETKAEQEKAAKKAKTEEEDAKKQANSKASEEGDKAKKAADEEAKAKADALDVERKKEAEAKEKKKEEVEADEKAKAAAKVAEAEKKAAAKDKKKAKADAKATAKVAKALAKRAAMRAKLAKLTLKSKKVKTDDLSTTKHTKLAATVPWLQVPDNPVELEDNTWNPNWRAEGIQKGDVRNFFCDAEDDDMATGPESPNKDNEKTNLRFIKDFQPSQLTMANFDAYHKKWESYKEMGKTIIKKETMDEYVDGRFESWNWSTQAQHTLDCKYFASLKKLDLGLVTTKEEKKKITNYYRDLEKAIAKERRHFRRQFEIEFRLEEARTVTGLRYNKTDNKFFARLTWQEEKREQGHMNAKKELIIPTERRNEELEVTEDWVLNQSGLADDVIQYIVDLDFENGFFPVPIDCEIKINDKPVTRIMFVPESTRRIIDVKAVQQDAVARLPEKRSREPSASQEKRVEVKKAPPRIEIKVPAHYRVQHSDGTTVNRDEKFVSELFPEKYLAELTDLASRFVDIPVGDYKVSDLHRHPHLRKNGAPLIRFVQEKDQDLCVSNSLASAVDNLGFHEAATLIVEFGKRFLEGGSVDALDKVVHYATGLDNVVLPRWIQPKKKPLSFDWKELLQDTQTIFVGVLLASDGNCSHAVTIHGGFIYDANESVALPLCQDALDYCTTTPTQKSTFVRFRRGWLLRYTGKDKCRVWQMSGKKDGPCP